MSCDVQRHDCGGQDWRKCFFQEDGIGEVPRFCYRHWGEWGEEIIRAQAREMVNLMEESSVFRASVYDERNPSQLEKTPISEATLAGVRDLLKERREHGQASESTDG